MALQKFTDAAGREAYLDPSTQRVFTEGGSRDTFYTLDQWNKRQLDKYGKSSSSSSSSKSSSKSSNSSSVTNSFSATPQIDLTKLYSGLMASPEITKATQDIAATEAEIQAKQKARDEQVALVNDNPYLSEATRVGKVAKVNEKANADLTTLEYKRNNLLNQQNALKSDAETQLNLQLKQYDINNAQYVQNLQIFDKLLAGGALYNASSGEIADLAKATGFTTNQINSIIQTSKAANMKPQVIQSTDNNGNVTISVVDTTSGKLINQTSLGGVGTSKSSSTSSDGINTSKITDKDVGFAIKVLDEQDAANYGSKDKLLSAWEITAALNALMAKYGNTDVAYQLLAEAMNRGGYSEWKG